MKKNENKSPVKLIFHIIQGALIGLGAVLPGISGGVLSVIIRNLQAGYGTAG